MTLSTTLSTAAVVLVSSSWANASSVVSIDSVERSIVARAHETIDRPGTDATSGSFLGLAQATKIKPNKDATATAIQMSEVSSEEFGCQLKAVVDGNQLKARAVSSIRIEFTVEEREGFQPGDGVVQLELSGSMKGTDMNGNVECRGPMSFDGIGYSLWHGDVLIGEHLLGPVFSEGESEFYSSYTLVPGTYVFEAQSGIVVNRQTSDSDCTGEAHLGFYGSFDDVYIPPMHEDS